VHVNGGIAPVLEGLRKPQGVLLAGDELFVVDSGAHEIIAYSLRTHRRETVATNVPVGAPPGVVPKPLMGIPGLLQGPLTMFAGITQGRDGTIYVSADGEGSILALHRA
jgi:hypothetical protein